VEKSLTGAERKQFEKGKLLRSIFQKQTNLKNGKAKTNTGGGNAKMGPFPRDPTRKRMETAKNRAVMWERVQRLNEGTVSGTPKAR